MNSALQHAGDYCPQDWIPVDEAHVLMDMSLRHLRRLANTQWMAQGMAELRPPRNGRGKPTWWIKRRVDKRLSLCPGSGTRAAKERASLLSLHSAHYVEAAYRKLRWLMVLRDRLAAPRLAGETDLAIARAVVADAKSQEDPQFKISVRSLQLWKAAHDSLDPAGTITGVVALIPQYGSGNTGGDARRCPQAIKHFYDLYRSQVRFSLRICHDSTLRQAQRRKWSWPAAYHATRRWLRKYDDIPLSYLCRFGQRAYSKRYMPHLEMDWSKVQPGEFYTADHTQVDFWVTYKSKQIRPWLTVIQDCRTRCITGWRLEPSPNQEVILLAMRQAFGDWAVPKYFRVDNGKDFTAKAITGLTKRECRVLRAQAKKEGRNWKDSIRRYRSLMVCDDLKWQGVMTELGIEVIYAIPYAAWSKGTVERFFRTFHEQCGKLFATYCGNSPTTRPESLSNILEGRTAAPTAAPTAATSRDLQLIDAAVVPSIEDARQQIGAWLDVYHNSPHQGQGVDGKTPLTVWNTACDSLQKADPDALAFLLSIRGSYKVGPNGVAVQVAGTRLSYGGKSSALKRWTGRSVLVAVDLEYPAHCFAFDPDTRRMIGRLDPNQRIHPFTQTQDVRESIADIQRERKGMHQAQRSAARRTITAVQRANDSCRQQVAEIRATGTDVSQASIVPVRTGFEGQSKPAAVDDIPRRDLSEIASALTFNMRPLDDGDDETKETTAASLDILAPKIGVSIDDEDDDGTDAERSPPDPLSLVAGIRHDRKSDK